MKSAFFRKAASVVVAAFTLMTVVAAVPSASANPANDPTPENIGVLTTKSGIDVSTLQVIGENGSPITAVGGLGSHGGHETRLVRTEYGTYVSYITEHIKREDIPANDTDHEHWGNGIAVFKIMKITSEGSHVIFTGEYPKANGSCTPNVLNAGDGKLYVTILCENPDRYYETMGTPEFTNSGWYTVYEVDMTTDNVTNVASTKFDYPTSPLDDHGYGYTQPILDREHGKLYALACGGEAPGFLAWNILDLNTMTWDPTCHCVQLFARYCYINGYPDGKGGFTVVIERDAPSSALAEAIGCTFTSDGYFFDAVNIMHVPDPTVDALEDHVVWEPNYKPGGNNFQASASHYGSGGCTYLDNEGRLHVIYSVTYFTTPTSRTTKVSGVYHAVFDLDGNEIYNELIPTALLDKNGTKTYSGPNGFVMTQAWDGTYYIFLLWGGTTGTKLEAWSSPSSDGIEFTRAFKDVPLKTADGVSPADGTHPIIANSRNFSVRDGIAAIIFHTGGSAGDPYYYFSVKLDEPVPHDHVWVETVTEPTCANEGYTVKVCSICGERIIDDRTPALGHEWGEWTVTVEPTEQATGVRERVCSRCGATDSEELPPVAHVHDYVAVVTPPTCTGAGFTTYTCACGDTYTGDPVDPLGHTPGETVIENAVDGSCTVGAYREEVVYCTVCGEEISREVKTTEAPGHDYVAVVTPPTCTEGGYTTYTCSRCGDSYVGDETDAVGHAWDGGVETVAPTADAEGVRTYTCTVCGETRTEPIPKLEPTHVPGDINGDGTVNSKDLTRLLKYLSGVDVEVNEAALDVNGDGAVNSKDLTRLLKFVSGLDVVIF